MSCLFYGSPLDALDIDSGADGLHSPWYRKVLGKARIVLHAVPGIVTRFHLSLGLRTCHSRYPSRRLTSEFTISISEFTNLQSLVCYETLRPVVQESGASCRKDFLQATDALAVSLTIWRFWGALIQVESRHRTSS